MKEKGISIQVKDDVRDWVALKGYDPKYGARPIARFIQEHIKRPLVDEVLFGNLEKGGHVVIGLENDKATFHFESESHLPKPAKEAAPKEKKSKATAGSSKKSSDDK